MSRFGPAPGRARDPTAVAPKRGPDPPPGRRPRRVALSPIQARACRSAGPVWGVLRVHSRAQCADKRRVISRPLRSTRVPFGPPLAAVAIALLALAAAGPARASTWTVTLAPKSGTGKDTYIRQGFSTQTNGS